MTNYEEPDRGRAMFSQDASGTTVKLPPKPPLFSTVFLSGWLIAWLFGDLSAARQLQSGTGGPGLFLFGWLIAWTAGGAMALYTLLRQVFAQQYLLIDAGSVSTWSTILGVSFGRKNFRLADTTNLRVLSTSGTDVEGGRWQKISVAFDYGRRTVSVFQGLDEAEAEYVCRQLKARSPQLRIGNTP